MHLHASALPRDLCPCQWTVTQTWNLNTAVLQLPQRRCVNAKWLLLRLEKPSSLVACLRSNTKMLLSFFFFVLQAGPRGWRKAAHKVKVQLLHLRNATPSKAFLRHFNSFVISACQTWLEQRIIAARMQATQVKSISFDAARGLFSVFFPSPSNAVAATSAWHRAAVVTATVQYDRPDDRGAVSRDLSPK